MAEEHPLKPFYSVLVLAFACSALVSVAAVGLRPYQEANRLLDQKKNILQAAGIYQPEVSIDQQFQAIEARTIDLATGEFVPETEIDPATFNQLDAALSYNTGRQLDQDEDLAGISRQENYSLVYLVQQDGQLSQIVLPVRGKGLWSTMFAYVAIENDLTTIRGISFYEHGETPGLGGEIANPTWQSRWRQKQIYGPEGAYELEVVKGGSQIDDERKPYTIDGISGATLTTNGVDNLMQFWFGEHGFKPFFERLKQQGGFNG